MRGHALAAEVSVGFALKDACFSKKMAVVRSITRIAALLLLANVAFAADNAALPEDTIPALQESVPVPAPGVIPNPPTPMLEPFRVAVVGAGIGGSSAAYFLKEIEPGCGRSLSVTIFEKTSRVGGRIRARKFENHTIELGAGHFVEANRLVYNYTRNVFKLELDSTEDDTTLTGFWDGNEMVFTQSGYSIVNYAKLIYRYGTSPWYVSRSANAAASKFEGIYDQLPFISVPDVLHKLDLLSLANRTFQSDLEEQRIDQLFSDEIVSGVLRTIYGQDLDMSALAGYVSMIAAERVAFSVKGGNQLLAEAFARASDAQVLLDRVVDKIIVYPYEAHPKYRIYSRGSVGGFAADLFDAVIIACPLTNAHLLVPGVDLRSAEIEYQTTVETVIRGRLNATYFGYATVDDLPQSIIATKNASVPFNAISFVAMSDVQTDSLQNQSLYVLSSRQNLTRLQLQSMFESYTILESVAWQAYPKLKPRNEFPLVELHPNLYYVQSFEAAFSTMETTVLSAKNVAMRILQKLINGEVDRPDDYVHALWLPNLWFVVFSIAFVWMAMFAVRPKSLKKPATDKQSAKDLDSMIDAETKLESARSTLTPTKTSRSIPIMSRE